MLELRDLAEGDRAQFAGKIGDILTTLPPEEEKSSESEDVEDYTPLPFWHYI
jgi:hypothetical protein